MTVCRNILDHPTDEKYRSLSKSSEHFTEQVWQYPSAKHFLMLVGWVDDGDSVVYDGDLEILKHAAEALDKWKGYCLCKEMRVNNNILSSFLQCTCPTVATFSYAYVQCQPNGFSWNGKLCSSIYRHTNIVINSCQHVDCR